jgi:hypothetical protein
MSFLKLALVLPFGLRESGFEFLIPARLLYALWGLHPEQKGFK